MSVKQSLSHRIFWGSEFSLAPPLAPHLGHREGLAGCWPSATQPSGAQEEAPGSRAWSTVAPQMQKTLVSWQLFRAEPKSGKLYF